MTVHPLVLDADTDKDVGFSALAYSAQHGAFIAASYAHGSLWRIDSLLERAQKISLSAPIREACGVAVRPRGSQSALSRLADVCVHTPHGGWSVILAPDWRSAQGERRALHGTALAVQRRPAERSHRRQLIMRHGTDNFDGFACGAAPQGWTCGVTGKGAPKWAVETDPSARSAPNVLRQSAFGNVSVVREEGRVAGRRLRRSEVQARQWDRPAQASLPIFLVGRAGFEPATTGLKAASLNRTLMRPATMLARRTPRLLPESHGRDRALRPSGDQAHHGGARPGSATAALKGGRTRVGGRCA